MTKEEKIKEAWGEYYKKYKDRVSLETGFMFYKSEKIRKEVENGLGELDFPYMYSEFRPKSLQGIESNNGWIKIESEEDLPKDNDDIFVYIDGFIHLHSEVIALRCLTNTLGGNITHYQPINKPNPPIY